MRLRKLGVLLATIALMAAACGSDSDSTDSATETTAAPAATTAAPAAETFVLGVSNTTVGNG